MGMGLFGVSRFTILCSTAGGQCICVGRKSESRVWVWSFCDGFGRELLVGRFGLSSALAGFSWRIVKRSARRVPIGIESFAIDAGAEMIGDE